MIYLKKHLDEAYNQGYWIGKSTTQKSYMLMIRELQLMEKINLREIFKRDDEIKQLKRRIAELEQERNKQ